MTYRYLFNLDNVLCITNGNDFINAQPLKNRIKMLNGLKDEGHHITIWTDREAKTGLCHTSLTYKQLSDWGIKYDKLLLTKPLFDKYCDCNCLDINKLPLM